MRAPVLLTLCAVLCLGCSRTPPRKQAATASQAAKTTPDTPAAATARAEASSVERAFTDVPKDVRFLVFGGGAEPLSNQISLAQDLSLVRSILDGPGLTLFASGESAQVSIDMPSNASARSDVRVELARLFGLPGAERTRYERAKLHIDGPATSEHVRNALERAIASGKDPLFIYGASHGDQGDSAADNSLSLWGGWSLTVKDVAELIDHAQEPRPLRFVITACFGGGFAELAFLGADEKRGARTAETCGLFAAPWDDEASGCDPNPDRRAQESYAIHFLHALSGNDRQNADRSREIDLDGDGHVGLLEAHTWARTQARSFDIPTTTSERYLRSVARGGERAALDPLSAPEEVAVVRALGQALELDDEAHARSQLGELDRILEDARTQVHDAQAEEEDSYHALRIALLERFPLLEHPWEKRTQELIDTRKQDLLHLLTESELAEAHEQAARELDEAVVQEDGVRVERARVLRLVRAFETLRLSTVLKKKGGKAYEHFRALRTCESWVPRLRALRGR
jgi:hypothetical protein